MRSKNAIIMLVLSFFTCYSMKDNVPADNSMTSMIKNHMIRARKWGHNFYMSYQEFGIVPTLSASFGMYDFQRITGLDENMLDTYSLNQLQNAADRIQRMMAYRGGSQKLADFLNKIESARISVEARQEANAENILYSEEKTERDIQELLKKQREPKR